MRAVFGGQCIHLTVTIAVVEFVPVRRSPCATIATVYHMHQLVLTLAVFCHRMQRLFRSGSSSMRGQSEWQVAGRWQSVPSLLTEQ